MKKDFNFFEKFGAIYILVGINKMHIDDGLFSPAKCPLSFSVEAAELKHTKTLRLMLRCDNCRLLLFANGIFSQEILRNLPNYQQPNYQGPYRRLY